MAAGSMAQWGNDLYTGRRSYKIVQRRALWFWITGALVALSLLVLGTKGFNLGIDFEGGSEFTITNIDNPSQDKAVDAVQSVAPSEEPEVVNLGSNGLQVRTGTLSKDETDQVKTALAKTFDVDAAKDVGAEFIGPTWGSDVSKKAIEGVIAFVLLVAAFMAIYFRNWRMSLAAIIALMADLVISAGVYAVVGWEVTPSTVIGFLTILGYSLYDKVVVFDKVRENTAGIVDQTRATYAERANLAVNQTLVRSINTGVVALLPVGGILFVGGFLLGAGTLRDIALSLFVGIAVGTISSIFLATPLEVTLREREPAIKANTAKILAARAQAAEQGDDPDLVASVGSAQLQPGAHQGIKAQPRRKR
ncbi:protein translocase subunit SecF [Luteimicrobium xylanilyticum]|uniref:Protein-export membrane protein SecF n=1 Tax=Luteimicrobium xylanilyticum TaxID=1133546 RepID=A0A5P9QAW9_9MICO|nr:protein translocase subunit SecF [Luteimicrobium xylanilyticum]QFU98386.1 Protein translocase subunit SecF [Luteimicrobium xylanilyticum]